MKNIILLICLTIFTATLTNAQTAKKHNTLSLSAANGEYWQSSSDEGLVKCGRGYFLNKMVIKTNYDAPDDLMEVDELTTTETAATKKTSTSKVTTNKTDIIVASNTIATIK